MSRWYEQVRNDTPNRDNLIKAILNFEDELEQAKKEVKLKGSVERASSELPGIVEHRFNQLQEIEAILKLLEIQHTTAKSKAFKNFLENYNRALSSRDAEKYADSDSTVVDLAILINQVALLRNQYLGIMKGLDFKHWQINNLVKLKVAGMEDFSL